jgi:hypothetical protein
MRKMTTGTKAIRSERALAVAKSPLHSLTRIGQFSMSVIAFHEKAGPSQVGSLVFFSNKLSPPPSGH